MFMLGSKNKKIVQIRIVAFFDTEKAYITDSRFICNIKWLDQSKILTTLQTDIENKGFTLVLRTDNDFELPPITTEELLKVI